MAAVHHLEHHRGLPGSLLIVTFIVTVIVIVTVLLPPDPAVNAGEGALGQALALGDTGTSFGGPLCATPVVSPQSQGDFVLLVPPPILCSLWVWIFVIF